MKVKVNVISWVEYWTLLEAGASGGELPDVFWMHINEAQKYMEGGILLNLDDYIAADDSTDLTNYYEGITAIYSNDGHQYALPKDHDTIALLYNKAIFDKYGVAYPTDDWTWEDYAAAAAQITEAGAADGVYGTAMNTNDCQDGWYNFIYDWGGYLLSEDKKTSGMDDANTIAGMTWLADNLFPSMPDQGAMANTDPDVLFLSGKIGMMLQGSWMVNTFYTAENAADYAWAEIPYNDANGNGQADEGERCSLYNGLGWAIDANTADPQAAYDLIAYLCSEEGQKKQAEYGVTMSGFQGCSEAFASAFEGMDISAFLKVEENGTLIQHPASRYTTRWEGMFTEGMIPGCWNDMDMLVVGMYGKGVNPETSMGGCTDEEYQTHFALWAMMNAPLIMGCDIRSLSPKAKEILTNRELIAIHQDWEGRSCYKLEVYGNPDAFVLVRAISGGDYAAGFFNFGDAPFHVSLNFWDMGLSSAAGYGMQVRDCYSHEDLGLYREFLAPLVPPHGSRVFRCEVMQL